MEGVPRKNRWMVVGLLILTIAAAVGIPSYIVKTMSDTPAELAAPEELFRTVTPSPTADYPPAVTGQVETGSLEHGSGGEVRSGSLNNCTFPTEYWKQRPDDWPIEGLQIGSLALDKTEAVAVLLNDPADTRAVLLQQLVVYALNTFRGANPEAVLPTIKEVSDWIETYNALETLPDPALEQGQKLAKTLSLYNTGLIGPGICPDITDTPTPAPTDTPTATVTPSPTATTTPTPVPFIPTNTSASPPGNPPTKPPQPPPPTPVPTQPPPPTPVPTQPPPPTSPPPTQPPTSAPPEPSTPTPAP